MAGPLWSNGVWLEAAAANSSGEATRGIPVKGPWHGFSGELSGQKVSRRLDHCYECKCLGRDRG